MQRGGKGRERALKIPLDTPVEAREPCIFVAASIARNASMRARPAACRSSSASGSPTP